ncbi:hypothetical protein ACTD5D_20120 [Nocardia takedensis]|uniref:hypothetical protein n=1 Tax=Nocardia takedensis TaxID=259390 RepID=UPI0012F6C693|nr:hypothetical protein [Nocardia takedensis]
MTATTPDTLVTVLGEIVRAVRAEAAAVAQRFEEVLDTLERDADQGWRDLKRLVSPPDWWCLLVFVLVRIRELDPDHLTVGCERREGWSRLLTLRWDDDEKSCAVGLAVTDPDLAHGLLLRLRGAGSLRLGDHRFGLELRMTAGTNGDTEWVVPFGGALAAPTADATVAVSVWWDPGLESVRDGPVNFEVGPLVVTATLNCRDNRPSYVLEAGLGTGPPENRHGVRAHLDLRAALGVVGEVVSLSPIDESYSPRARLASNEPPTYSLGRRGPA